VDFSAPKLEFQELLDRTAKMTKPPPESQQTASWSNLSRTGAFEQVHAPVTMRINAKILEAVTALRPITKTSRVLDVGAGTGSMTRVIRQQYPEVPIVALDLAPGMVESLEAQDIPNVTTGVADARDLDSQFVPDGAFTHALSMFVIQFVGPERHSDVCAELFRALEPGGVVALSSRYPSYAAFREYPVTKRSETNVLR
jgi:trans-aconitate methyltransferase